MTRIGDFAFNSCAALTSCMLPTGVRKTGKMLFWGCTALRSAHFPESLRKIEMWTFTSCRSLSEVYLPASLTEVGYEAFRGCDGVTAYSQDNPAVKEYCGENGMTYWDEKPPRIGAAPEKHAGAVSPEKKVPAQASEKKPLWKRLFRGGDGSR